MHRAGQLRHGIPIFRLTKDLVGLSAAKNHCGLHTMSPELVKQMAKELLSLKLSGATIQFTPDQPLPREDVRCIVELRLADVSP